MLEMVRGKTSTTGGPKSRSSSPVIRPKTIPGRDDRLPTKRKSRSPSPTPKFGQTETLQRENIMRMRQQQQQQQQQQHQQQQQQLDRQNLENGCRPERPLKPTAKKSINPRKLCAAQVEIIQEIIQDGAKARQQDERTPTPPLPPLLDPLVNSEKTVDHVITNGAVSDHGKDDLPVPVDRGVKKVKIDVEFEDSDDDEEENDCLKKVMENIEKDLNVAEDIKKGVATKRPDGPIAPINSSWLEFSCREGKCKDLTFCENKRKELTTPIVLNPFLVMVENGIVTTPRNGPTEEKVGEKEEERGEEEEEEGGVKEVTPEVTAASASSDEDSDKGPIVFDGAVFEELRKDKRKNEDQDTEEERHSTAEMNACDNVDHDGSNRDEGEKNGPSLKSPCSDVVTVEEDSPEKVKELDDTVNLSDSISDPDPIPEVEEDRSVVADTKDEISECCSKPVPVEESEADSSTSEPGNVCESSAEVKAESEQKEQDKTTVEVDVKEVLCDEDEGTAKEVELNDSIIIETPVVKAESAEQTITSESPVDKVEEPCKKIDDDVAVVHIDDDVVKEEKKVDVDVKVTEEVAGSSDEPKVVDVESESECPSKRKRETEQATSLEELAPLDKKVKVDEANVPDLTVLSVDKSEEAAEVVEKEEKDCYPNLTGEIGEQKKKEKVYRLTKSELEMLVICKVTEFFSDANKSEIGALRRRCEQLEKLLGQARKKDILHQRQLADLQIVIQRMQASKRFPHPPKPLMRSVGLQVQLTRYIPADPTKLVSRVTTLGVQGNKPMMVSNVQNQQHTIQGQQMVLPKQVAGGQLAFVANLGAAGALNGTTLVSKSPVASQLGSTPTVATVASPTRPRAPCTSVIGSRSPISVMKSPGTPLGVSLLPPKNTNIGPGLVITGAISGSTPTSITATRMPMIPVTSQASALRTALDPPKMNATSSATPIPMRLVPNQAVARQLTPTSVTSTNSSSATTNTPRAMTVNMVGQPPVVAANGVKIIDLTADEEDANAQLKGLQTVVGGTTGTISVSISSANSFSNVAMVSSALSTGTNPVTVLAPTTVSGVSNGQIIALSAGQPVGTMVSGTNTLTTPSSIRMTTPLRPGTSLVNSGPVRLAYLMPSTSMVTMMRPNQSVFVAPTAGVRPGQPGMRPNVPTFVLQRGTALVPLQQGQVTSLSSVRPASITPQITRLSAPNTSVAPVTVMNSTSTIRPLVASPTVSSTSSVSSSANVTPVPATITYSRPIMTNSSVQSNLNVKTVLPPHSPLPILKHPAPLPLQPTYNENALMGRKALPPKPALKISKVTNGIVLSWNMCLNVTHAEIASYQLYAYQEGSSLPNTNLWKKVGDVKALPLPMACTLTQFMEGNKYYFAVRAIDVHHRFGQFSDPGSIALISATNAVATTKQSQGMKT